MRRVRFLPEAEADLGEAFTFLESRVPGMGSRLVGDVGRAVAKLSTNHAVGPQIGNGYRKVRTLGFPYNVIYRVHESEVVIVAIAHHRRRPDFWRRRG